MAKLEWGKKRICPSCNTKYYDFNKSPIICPSCGTEFDPDIYLKSRKGKSLSLKVVSENNKDTSTNIPEDIENIDDVEIDSEDEVVNDEETLHELNKSDESDDSEVEINIDGDISFIDEDEINEDDGVNVEIIDEKKE